jgi:riboflavin-specific deaminase-like protein
LLPFVLMNLAVTADGKIATANRALSSFGSPQDHEELLRLRTRADAIMAGARTVDLNPVTMGTGAERFRRARLRQGRAAQPVRVIVSRLASVSPDAEIFQHRFSPIIVLTTTMAPRERLDQLRAVADEVRSFGRDEIDFRRALAWLRRTRDVEQLLCEGGGELNDALFRAGLVDELHLTVCPYIFGGRSAPTIADGTGLPRLALARRFVLQSMRRRVDEMFLVYAKV